MKKDTAYCSSIRKMFPIIFTACLVGFSSFPAGSIGKLGNAGIGDSEPVFEGAISAPSPVEYINSYFENASPLFWEYNDDGSVDVHLIYDHERSSANRASNHWHFQVHAKPGSDVTVYIRYFDEIWNNQVVRSNHLIKYLYLSEDGERWFSVPVEVLDGNSHKLNFRMDTGSIYVAGMEPYRLSDLDNMLARIKDHPLVDINYIGATVEGRPLEIIHVGDPGAPYSVFIRARAHPWEAGGNWVVQGLVNSLLDAGEHNQSYFDRYSVYIMPMANKDGVARGMTRFNLNGMDLNRNWESLADPVLAPENHALETWLINMIKNGKKPDLAIDLHNDRGGTLLVSRPQTDTEQYLANMQRFESLLREHTWFREGVTHGFNYGIGYGLAERYGIDGLVYELNQVWIRGLNKIPFGEDWELLGKQLRDVFYHYFDVSELN